MHILYVHIVGEYIEKDGCIRRVGKGVHHAADSSVYSGRWKDDKLNGEGEHRHCSGIVYKVSREDTYVRYT